MANEVVVNDLNVISLAAELRTLLEKARIEVHTPFGYESRNLGYGQISKLINILHNEILAVGN